MAIIWQIYYFKINIWKNVGLLNILEIIGSAAATRHHDDSHLSQQYPNLSNQRGTCMECAALTRPCRLNLVWLKDAKFIDAKFSLSPYKMYGAYWSNAEQKVQVPGQFRLGNPGSALPGMSSACCIDIIQTRHHLAQKSNLVRIGFRPVDLKSIFGLKEDKWNMKGFAPQWFDHCPI